MVDDEGLKVLERCAWFAVKIARHAFGVVVPQRNPDVDQLRGLEEDIPSVVEREFPEAQVCELAEEVAPK